MKRCIVVDVKTGKDDKTNEDLVFLTLYQLASPMKKGGLWHPKRQEAVSCACAGKNRNSSDFDEWSKMPVGTVVNVTYGVSDFNNKPFVAIIERIVSPRYDKDLFV